MRKESDMSTVSQKLDEVIHEIAYENIEGDAPQSQSDPLLAKLGSLGTRMWIDTGDLEKARSVWKSELTALTTNNTLANQVVQSGIMDAVIRDTVAQIRNTAADLTEQELVTEIGFVINCKIALRLVQAFKVQVSVELHPSMSRDMDRSLLYARRYHRVCPDYFIVKIPLTPEGLLAVRKLRLEGLPINFTLGFSARQNYLAARLSNPNYVNVFLGRLNQVVIDNSLGSGEWVGEKVTLATQAVLRDVRNNHAEVGSLLIGASIRSGAQVAFLAGLDVLTIPPAALTDYVESGKTAAEITDNIGRDIEPGIDSPNLGRFLSLWEVSDAFKEFTDKLLQQENLEQMSGAGLRSFCMENGHNLFHPFSNDDLQKIQDHGKIPRLADWSHDVAVDDLMTNSALQSFTKDQNALDDRIRSFL